MSCRPGKNATGVIPVLDGYDGKFPLLEYANGGWKIAEEVAPPVLDASYVTCPITFQCRIDRSNGHYFRT